MGGWVGRWVGRKVGCVFLEEQNKFVLIKWATNCGTLSGRGRRYILSTQLPVQWVQRDLSTWVNWLGHTPFISKDKNKCLFTCTPLYTAMAHTETMSLLFTMISPMHDDRYQMAAGLCEIHKYMTNNNNSYGYR